MKSLTCFLAACAAALAATPSGAAPPPLPVAVTVYSLANDDVSLTKALGLAGPLISEGWFAESTSHLAADRPNVGQLRQWPPCADEQVPLERCLRGFTAQTRGNGPPEVVVIADPQHDGRVELHCIGPGDAEHDAGRQTVVISLDDFYYPNEVRGSADRRAAAACIIAAAAESGW